MAWETKRMKDLFELNPILRKKGIDAECNVSFVPMECLRCGNIEKRIAKYDDVKSYTPFQNGDLLMAKVTPCFENGNIAIAENLENGIGFGSSEIFVLRSKSIFIKYAFFLSLSNVFHSIGCPSMKGVGGLKRIDPTHLLGSPVRVPSLSEQQRIASYLDKQTASIDSRIALLEKKKEKYLVLRKAVINEAVTPKEGWKEVRLKDVGYLYSGLSGKSGDDFHQDEDERNRAFIPFTNIFNNDVINPNVMGHVTIEEGESQNRVKKGDLFFLMSSEDYDGLGKSSLLNVDLGETYLNSFCKGFRLKNKCILPEFLNYLLQSFGYRNKMKIEGKGFTRMNLKSEKVSCFSVKLPNIDEQKRLAKIITIKVGKIDTIVSKITDQIENLKVLRKCIINESVREK